MHFGYSIGLFFIFSGVLSAPLDSPEASPDKKNNEPLSPTVTSQSSDGSSLTKKDSTFVSPEDTAEKADPSLIKDDKGSKPTQLNDNSSPVVKNADVKSDVKNEAEVSTASRAEDKNNTDELSKDNQGNTKVEASPEIAVHLADVQIENEVVDKKEKELFLKAGTRVSTAQDGKQVPPLLDLAQKPTVSQAIGNFIYEIMQTPIYLLKAFKDMIGGMLGIRKPVAATTIVTASAP